MLAVPGRVLPLCEALAQISAATWYELGAGEACAQPLDEESVTNYNLMRLASAVPAIIVEKHSKQRERRTGADWEWWVGRPGAYVGFRIQAKRLDSHLLAYQHLYRARSTALDQINRLILQAEASVPRLYPLLAFYNFWFSGLAPTVSSPCGAFGTLDPFHGWTISSAYVIRDILLRSPTKKLSAFRSTEFPVLCLFCCPATCSQFALGGTEGSLAEAVATQINSRWRTEREVLPEVLVHPIAPVYVERMFKGERPEDGWAEMGLPPPIARYIPRDLSRVLLLREVAPTE